MLLSIYLCYEYCTSLAPKERRQACYCVFDISVLAFSCLTLVKNTKGVALQLESSMVTFSGKPCTLFGQVYLVG